MTKEIGKTTAKRIINNAVNGAMHKVNKAARHKAGITKGAKGDPKAKQAAKGSEKISKKKASGKA